MAAPAPGVEVGAGPASNTHAAPLKRQAEGTPLVPSALKPKLTVAPPAMLPFQLSLRTAQCGGPLLCTTPLHSAVMRSARSNCSVQPLTPAAAVLVMRISPL